ncbi:MAG: DUF1553 domain-containing protein [Verrucomicrobia bacterium]|nr:DUF1553 domain-containing protein [Verrucomicrobiota bacterium]
MLQFQHGWLRCVASFGVVAVFALTASATSANKTALVKHYDKFLPKSLNACTTCHLPSENKHPETLAEFPHNPFGDRLRKLGEEAAKAGRKLDIPHRLAEIAKEDADGDGASNETELLLGHAPGNAKDVPTKKELVDGKKKLVEWTKALAAYRWKPFEPVQRPAVPQIRNSPFVIRNSIDAFIAKEHQARGLKPRPEASREVLLRRVYLDLIGLSPTPEEMSAFLADKSADAYERAVDRLLDSPRYGERWARHWMDVWRYSDWTGYQNVPRDSKPHIWRWRDWIIESLNADRGYDRMLMEMLAADELAPTDESALRATGFLVRNFNLLSRERWLENTIGHTFQAFQGVTMNCAKCHDHMYDPISQREYYEVRSIFEGHQVRTDRVPGTVDTEKTGDGLVRAYDATMAPVTYILARGDERRRLTNEVIQPNLPRIFGANYAAKPVTLPPLAVRPDKREFVVNEDLAAAEKSLEQAREHLRELQAGAKADEKKKAVPKTVARAAAAAVAKLPPQLKPLPAAKTIPDAERNVALAEARVNCFKATLAAEKLESKKNSTEWKQAAEAAVVAQRKAAVLESRLALTEAETAMKAAKTDKTMAAAKKTLATAEKAMAKADKDLTAPVTTAYAPNKFEAFPPTSTGRRLALAQWFANKDNPLTARVAVNHIWAHHFGRGLVPTLNEFGRNGQPPSHPQLLDWLAAELMSGTAGVSPAGFETRAGETPAVPGAWSQKHLHRLIVTSSTYRLASTPDAASAKLDRDNVYLWRMNSRRMEAEAVRDNVLHISGSLDLAMGGPDIDNKLGLTSKRRSVYLRIAPEKEVEFIKIFDGPNPVECYSRPVTVMPHQALAMANSELTFTQADVLAETLTAKAGNDDTKFITAAYERVLARKPTKEEAKLCVDFLKQQTALQTKPVAQKSVKTSEVMPVAATPATINKMAAAKPAEAPKPAAKPVSPAQRARENLVMVLFNHNDFVTIR